MGNILSYLKWRGDLSFEEQPFCRVDALILSMFSYLDLKGIVPEDNSQVSMKTACDQYISRDHGEYPGENFVLCISQAKRFENVKLSRYLEIYDEQKSTQFSSDEQK